MNDSNRRFPVFSIRQLFLAVAVSALATLVWRELTLNSVRIRPPREGDPVIAQYPSRHVEFKSIALIDGEKHYTEEVNLSLFLYAAHNGQAKIMEEYMLNRLPVTTTNKQDGTMLIALEYERTGAGLNVSLKTDGDSNGSGRVHWRKIVSFNRNHSHSFDGTLREEREYVLHAEGDSPVRGAESNSLSEFLDSNLGNYLIVTARLHSHAND